MSKKIKERRVKNPYERTRVVTKVKERRTKAVQSERKSADINNIVARAYQTGQLPVLMGRQHIEQLPDVESYQDAMNKVVFAQQQFERLPAAIRDEFDNDPSKMLQAVSQSGENPELKKKLQTLGLIETPETPSNPPAEQSPEGATGGVATAEPTGDPVPSASEGS